MNTNIYYIVYICTNNAAVYILYYIKYITSIKSMFYFRYLIYISITIISI